MAAEYVLELGNVFHSGQVVPKIISVLTYIDIQTE
jgi:hypothetical protein